MVKMYENGYSSTKISKALNKTENCILNNLRFRNIKIKRLSADYRKIPTNTDYFKEINTPEKAYWLGFIYADGNIHQSKNVFKIKLWGTDRYALLNLRSLVSPNSKIADSVKNGRNYSQLSVYNREFCSYLIDKGVIPAKTTKLAFPKFLEPEFYPSFLLGLLDGDGCISYGFGKSNNTHTFTFRAMFAGAPQIMQDIVKILSDILGVKAVYKIVKNSNGTKADMSHIDSLKFFEFIYSNPPDFFLHRKYIKFIKIIKILRDNFNRKNEETKNFIIRCEKIIETNIINNKPNNFSGDLSLSSEEIEILEAMKTTQSRIILQFSKDMAFIKGWESASEAAKFYDIDKYQIGYVCNGQFPNHGGYIWRYLIF